MMAVEPSTKAKLVSARELTRMVDEAVKSAGHHAGSGGVGDAERLGGQGNTVVLRPEIVGRIVRDHGQAQQFADAVAKSIGHAGVQVDAVVLPYGPGGHLAGFVERHAVQLREL